MTRVECVKPQRETGWATEDGEPGVCQQVCTSLEQAGLMAGEHRAIVSRSVFLNVPAISRNQLSSVIQDVARIRGVANVLAVDDVTKLAFSEQQAFGKRYETPEALCCIAAATWTSWRLS